MTSTARLASLTLAAALGACSYAYENPAESLGAGEVAGRAVDGAALSGVAVSLHGSELTTTSRGGGQFALLPLPVGRHTLALRDGKDRAARIEVDVGLGQDGKPQGLWIGDVAVPATVGIEGTCTLPGGVALGDDGLAVDEVTGATARVGGGATGHFAFQGLPVGLHRIRVFATDGAGNAFLGGPAEVELAAGDAGLQKTLLPMALRPATAATGSVALRLSLVGTPPGLALGDLTVAGLGPITVSSGVARTELAEGLWTVAVGLPGGAPGVTAPPPVKLIVLAGESLDLGTFHAVGDAARDRAELSCHSSADCGAGSCSGGVCVGFTPPDVAPAGVPFCDPATHGCAAGAALGVSSPVTMTCVAGTGLTAGVACGACCTPDGVQVLSSAAGVGGCPALP